MDLILVAVISLGAIGLISAVILYAASKKFAVYEDPRIGQVAEVLPQFLLMKKKLKSESFFREITAVDVVIRDVPVSLLRA